MNKLLKVKIYLLLLIILLPSYNSTVITATNPKNINKNNLSTIAKFTKNLGIINDPSIIYFATLTNYIIGFRNSSLTFLLNTPNELKSIDTSLQFTNSNKVTPKAINQNLRFGYSDIWYYNIYTGIDLHYYFKDSHLKYDFVVQPFSNPDQINIKILNGIISGDGNKVEVRSFYNEINIAFHDTGLRVYQNNGEMISANFEINRHSNSYTYNLGSYDHNQSLIIDPIVSTIFPANNTTRKSGTSISYNLSTDATNITSITYSWDGTSYLSMNCPVIGKNASCITNFQIGDGKHFLYVYSTDTLGQTKLDSFVFKTDDTGPTFVLLTNSNNSQLIGNTTIMGTATDVSGVNVTFYKWDNDTIDLSWDYSSQLISTLPNQQITHFLHISLEDVIGNWNNKTLLVITTDNEPPVIQYSLLNESIVKSGTEVVVTVTDVNISLITYYWDNNSVSSITSPFTLLVPTNEGIHYFHIFTKDQAGNWNNKTLQINVDNTAPLINLFGIENNSIINGGYIFYLNVSDNNVNVNIGYKWDSNGMFMSLSPYMLAVPLNDGVHTLIISGVDTVGNWNNKTFYFITDNIAPVITLLNLNNDTIINKTTKLEFTIQEQNGLTSATFYWINSSIQGDMLYNTTVFTIIEIPESQGMQYLNITVIDKAGNTNSMMFMFLEKESTSNTNYITITNSITHSVTRDIIKIENNTPILYPYQFLAIVLICSNVFFLITILRRKRIKLHKYPLKGSKWIKNQKIMDNLMTRQIQANWLKNENIQENNKK